MVCSYCIILCYVVVCLHLCEAGELKLMGQTGACCLDGFDVELRDTGFQVPRSLLHGFEDAASWVGVATDCEIFDAGDG